MRKGLKIGRCFLWLKHDVVYRKGYGYRCSRCDKPLSQCKVGELIMTPKEYADHCKIIVSKYKSRCTYYSYEGPRVLLGIEDTKSTNPRLYRALKKIMEPVNISYRRWEFKIRNYYDE